ncbi:MAG: hypothetical protein P8099_15305 [Gemmatimonadota bacterium]|jgi:hypothetical protein
MDPDRALAIGVAVSVVLHALVFLVLSRIFLVPTPSVSQGRVVNQPTRLPGMQVFNIAPTQGAPAIEPTVPRRQVRPRAPTQPSAPVTPSQPAGEASQPAPLTPAERLRPRMGDARIWAPIQIPALPERPLTIEDVRARIASELRALNDSAAAAQAEAARGTNWTIKDKNGNVWGITPGKLHLGKITLPLPFSLPPASGEVGQREADWSAIHGQAAREAARENFKARVKAIRERKEKEHEEKLKKEKAQKQAPKQQTPPPSSGPPPP